MQVSDNFFKNNIEEPQKSVSPLKEQDRQKIVIVKTDPTQLDKSQTESDNNFTSDQEIPGRQCKLGTHTQDDITLQLKQISSVRQIIDDQTIFDKIIKAGANTAAGSKKSSSMLSHIHHRQMLHQKNKTWLINEGKDNDNIYKDLSEKSQRNLKRGLKKDNTNSTIFPITSMSSNEEKSSDQTPQHLKNISKKLSDELEHLKQIKRQYIKKLSYGKLQKHQAQQSGVHPSYLKNSIYKHIYNKVLQSDSEQLLELKNQKQNSISNIQVSTDMRSDQKQISSQIQNKKMQMNNQIQQLKQLRKAVEQQSQFLGKNPSYQTKQMQQILNGPNKTKINEQIEMAATAKQVSFDNTQSNVKLNKNMSIDKNLQPQFNSNSRRDIQYNLSGLLKNKSSSLTNKQKGHNLSQDWPSGLYTDSEEQTWKYQAPCHIQKRFQRQEKFRQFLNNELQSIQKIRQSPSFEMLYERHGEYHPQKLKINMDRQNNMHRENSMLINRQSLSKLTFTNIQSKSSFSPLNQSVNNPYVQSDDEQKQIASSNFAKSSQNLLASFQIGLHKTGKTANNQVNQSFPHMAAIHSQSFLTKKDTSQLLDSRAHINLAEGESSRRILLNNQTSFNTESQNVINQKQKLILPKINKLNINYNSGNILLSNMPNSGGDIGNLKRIETERKDVSSRLIEQDSKFKSQWDHPKRKLASNRQKTYEHRYKSTSQASFSKRDLGENHSEKSVIINNNTSQTMSDSEQQTSQLAVYNPIQYEKLLSEHLNRKNSKNKLIIRKKLIAQAGGQFGPKIERKFANDIISLLKDLNINSVSDLPGNKSMEVTIGLIQDSRKRPGLGKSPFLSRNQRIERVASTLPNICCSTDMNKSQLSQSPLDHATQQSQSQLSQSGNSQKPVGKLQKQKYQLITEDMLLLRQKDDSPLKSSGIQRDKDLLEPTYVSPHFDFQTQQLVEPKHMNELIKEIEANSKIYEFDKLFLAARLREVKFLKKFTQREQKLAIKRIKHGNKKIKVPNESEYIILLDQFAKSMFMFLSREQVQQLQKLGPLSEYLCDILIKDLSRKRNELLLQKYENDENVSQSQISSDVDMLQSQINSVLKSELSVLMSPQMYQNGGGSETTEVIMLRKRPHQQPKSQQFFELIKKNDVLKCLNMLKANPALSTDCDEERRTPLHWACLHDYTNLIQILIDFGADLNQKDDFSRRPIDEAHTYATNKKQSINPFVKEYYDLAGSGRLERDTSKYQHALYVKYLTPLEQVQELKEFIDRVNDMSTLTQKQRDQKAAQLLEEQELKRLEKEKNLFLSATEYFPHMKSQASKNDTYESSEDDSIEQADKHAAPNLLNCKNLNNKLKGSVTSIVSSSFVVK